MATTKIWPIRDSLHRVLDYAANPEKTVLDSDLRRVLHYAARSSKVTDEKRCFVSGINCRPETAFEQMQAVKEQFGKLGGIKDTVRAELDFDNIQMELETPNKAKSRGWAR